MFKTSPDPAQLAYTQFEVYPNVVQPITRGAQEKAGMSEALEAYQTGDYPRAIRLFEELLEAEGPTEPLLFYLGVAFLAEKQPEKAVAQLEKLQNTLPEMFVTQTQWYLALGYLELKSLDLARVPLQSLANQENAYQNKARDLLKKLY